MSELIDLLVGIPAGDQRRRRGRDRPRGVGPGLATPAGVAGRRRRGSADPAPSHGGGGRVGLDGPSRQRAVPRGAGDARRCSGRAGRTPPSPTTEVAFLEATGRNEHSEQRAAARPGQRSGAPDPPSARGARGPCRAAGHRSGRRPASPSGRRIAPTPTRSRRQLAAQTARRPAAPGPRALTTDDIDHVHAPGRRGRAARRLTRDPRAACSRRWRNIRS